MSLRETAIPTRSIGLLEKHRGPVRRLVEMRLDRKVQQRVDVSDVVQDVMIEASGRLEKYLDDPAMAFHLWLRQIAWDRIIDTYRRHRVSAKRNMDREQPMSVPAGADQSTMELAVQLCDPGLTPAAAATQREIASKVEAVIEMLSEQDREIILMRHYEHLSNLEIAEVLKLNPPAASMRYLVRRAPATRIARANRRSTPVAGIAVNDSAAVRLSQIVINGWRMLCRESTDAVCRGEIVDFERCAGNILILADELRQLWGAILVTDTAGAASDQGLDRYRQSPSRWRSLEVAHDRRRLRVDRGTRSRRHGRRVSRRQISLDREVAVKMILRGRLASDVDLQRFLAEATATARLEHPNIVPVYEVGDIDGRPFFSMQFVDGQTLAERVASDRCPNARRPRSWRRSHARLPLPIDQGVLHRDLKPSNILIVGRRHTADHRLRIGQTSRAASTDLTRSGMLLGTPAYMSPEQAGGRRNACRPDQRRLLARLCAVFCPDRSQPVRRRFTDGIGDAGDRAGSDTAARAASLAWTAIWR